MFTNVHCDVMGTTVKVAKHVAAILEDNREHIYHYVEKGRIDAKTLIPVSKQSKYWEGTALPLDNRKSYVNVPLINYSCFKRDANLLEALLEKNCTKKIKAIIDGTQMSPMHIAAAHDFLKGVELLISYGFSRTSTTDRGITPLMCAVSRTSTSDVSLKIVECLVKEQDEEYINFQDRWGQTALHYAADDQWTEAVELLLLNGANPNVQDHSGHTPLFDVIASNTYSHYRSYWYVVASDDRVKRGAEVAALLLKYNTNVDLQDLDGFTALHTICTKPCIENYLSMFEAVLKAGGDIHIKEKHGHPPLLTAVCFYNTEFVKILVKHYSPTRLSEKFALTNDIEDSVDYKSALLLAAERVEDLERQLRECYKVITLLIMGGHKIHADVFTIMRQCANFNFLYFPEMFEVIKKYRNNPRSLKDIARLEVRNAMPYPCPSNIAKLPLPLKIQKYVELEELDNVDKDVDEYIKETAEIREAREIEHSKRHFSTYVIRD